MSTQIFYFSGTGNSLSVAREISNQLSDSEIVPMIGAEKNAATVATAERIGLIFPVHAFSFPQIVEKFIKSLSIKPDVYLFVIATRMGSSCKVFENMDRLLAAKGVKISARWFLDMPNNYLTLLPLSNDEQIKCILENVDEKVKVITQAIKNKEIHEEQDPHYSFFEKYILFAFLGAIYRKTNYFGLENKFYADDKCNHCQVCTTVCLSGKIGKSGNKPYWRKDVPCYHCLACIHYCPCAAIQNTKKTEKKGRYHHPAISFKDIANQKYYKSNRKIHSTGKSSDESSL